MGIGGLLVAVMLHPTALSNPEELAVWQEVAKRLGVAPDWHDIFDFVSYTYLPLGLTKAEVHARLSAIGPFTVAKEEYYINEQGQPIDYERIVFDNSYVANELGEREYEFDSNSGLLVGALVILPTGEGVRLLPPP